MHFPEKTVEIGYVVDHQAAHNPVKGVVHKRQRLGQVVRVKNNIQLSGFRPRPGEHSLGEVQGVYDGPGRGEAQSVPPGSATDVHYGKTANVTDQAIHPRFFQGNERVIVLVIERSPGIVAGFRG
jgi:hypothetical protein